MRANKTSGIQLCLRGGIVALLFGSFYSLTSVNNSSEIHSVEPAFPIEDSTHVDSMSLAVIDGEVIFNTSCQSCHGSHVSHFRTAEQWTEIVNRMAPQAGLTDTTTAYVNAFVQWKLERTDSTFQTPVIGAYRQW